MHQWYQVGESKQCDLDYDQAANVITGHLQMIVPDSPMYKTVPLSRYVQEPVVPVPILSLQQPPHTNVRKKSYNYNKRSNPHQPHWNNSFNNRRNNDLSFHSPGSGSLRPRFDFDSPKTPQRYNSNTWNNSNFSGGCIRNSPPMRHIEAVAGDNFKTALCTQFKDTGHCRHGLQCHFAHGPEELRRQPVPNDALINNKYKTALCKQFTNTGKCNYGQQCLFAHGEAELRHGQNYHDAKECRQ